MAKAYGLANINSRLAASQEVYINKMPVDTIYDAHPFLLLLRKKAKRVNGGESININVEYTTVSNVQSYTGFQTLDVTGQDVFTNGNYRFRQYVGPVSISDEMRRENTQGGRIFDLVGALTKSEMKGVVNKLSEDIWASSQSGTNLDTLPAMISTTGTVGQISATGNTWWQATSTASGSFASQGLEDMRTTYHTISKEGTEQPDIMVTTQSIFEFIEKFAMTKGQIYLPPTRNTNLGFENFSYRKANIVWDNDATSGEMQFINSQFTYLVIDSGKDMKATKFVQPHNADAATSLIRWRGNLVTEKRTSLGKMTSVTA